MSAVDSDRSSGRPEEVPTSSYRSYPGVAAARIRVYAKRSRWGNPKSTIPRKPDADSLRKPPAYADFFTTD